MKYVIIATLGLILWILHGYHVYVLFENDRHFSHLSTLERELSFRSEMGLYFSYYKILVETDRLKTGMALIKNDNFTEYPQSINAFQRFNIHPELSLAILYHIFNYTSNNYLKTPSIECWWISRGEYPSVKSCVGLGDPINFYVTTVAIIAGSTAMSLFFLGYILSGSIYGAFIAVLQFFFNHIEATRVMWTIPLRESFGYPLFIFQTMLMTYMLKDSTTKTPSKLLSILLIFSNVALIISWQFAPFILFTQIVSVYILYILLLTTPKHRIILRRFLIHTTLLHMVALLVSYLLLFFNQSLLTSLYASALIAILICENEPFTLFSKLDFVKCPITAKAGSLLYYMTWVLGLKYVISKVLSNQDDNHIFQILISKFSTFRNFHTMLYTCSPEFDFLGKETYVNLSETLLLPSCGLALTLFLFRVFYKPKKSMGEMRNGDSEDSRLTKANLGEDEEGILYPEVCFNALQTGIFVCLAILIMRLKLLATPHLCLMASILARSDLYKFVPLIKLTHLRASLLICLIAASAYVGLHNVRREHEHVGEYLNIAQEEMMNWIEDNTRPDEAFAGPMPIMANIKLSTGRPIVNHPHYEDVNLRAKTKLVYTLFSRKSQREVNAILRNLSATYAVVEDNWCLYQRRDECTLPAIWDMEDIVNRRKKALCSKLRKSGFSSKYFTTVYRNEECSILRVIHPPQN